MTVNNFTSALRNFSIYFENKDFAQINDKTFSNGYLAKTRQENNASYINLSKEINFEQNLTASTFLQFAFDIFNTFTSDKDNLRGFHLEKENVIVVRFLYKLMTFKGEIGGVRLAEHQINSLKDVYISINQVFTENFEHYENLIIKRVDDRMDERLKTHAQNQNNQVNNNERSRESQIKNLVENNFSIFNPIRNLIKKNLKYKNHLTIHNTHKTQNSIHKKQSFQNYPEPWLQEDEDFVKEHNEIIENSQNKFLELMIKYTKIRLDKIETQIQDKLSSLENDDNFQEFETNEIYEFLRKREESNKKMMNIFLKAINKAKKCSKREFYKTKPIENNRSSISFNISSLNSTTASNTSRNSHTRHPRSSSKSNQNRSILKRSKSRNDGRNNNNNTNISNNNNNNNNNKKNQNHSNNKNKNKKTSNKNGQNYNTNNNQNFNNFNNENFNNQNHQYRNYNQNSNNQNYNHHQNGTSNQNYNYQNNNNPNHQNGNYNQNHNNYSYHNNFNNHQNFQHQNSNQYR
jgi:hypothetical protein